MYRRSLFAGFARVRVMALLGFSFLLATWSACRAPEDEPPAAAAAHAVDSERLELLMRQLEKVDSALLPQEIDPSAEQQRRRGEIAALAGALAQSAGSIPVVLEDVALSDEHRAVFLQLTKDLEDRAHELQLTAPDLGTSELVAQVETIRETCTACHTRFRVLPTVR